MFTRGIDGEVNYRSIVSEITDWAIEENEKDNPKIGVLICEGDENSIDKAVYSTVFPDLLVVPVGGCSNISRLLPKLRENLALVNMYAYGIIDRDALSKKEIKKLFQTKGIYTTKLPFIENIICSPEVLRYVCEYLEINYYTLVNKVEIELLKILWQKLKETLPINLGIDKYERILCLRIGASTKKQTIVKQVDKESILYSFRDKIITLIVGTHIGLKGKKAYYEFMINLINNEDYKESLSHAFANFIPKFELYELE